MSANRILFFTVLLYILPIVLSANGTLRPCFTCYYHQEEKCELAKSTRTTTSRCKVIIWLTDDCEFKAVVAGSDDDFKPLKPDPAEVGAIFYSKTRTNPTEIIKVGDGISGNWTLSTHSHGAKCIKKIYELICIFFADSVEDKSTINRDICPEPTTTTITSTTKIRDTTVAAEPTKSTNSCYISIASITFIIIKYLA